MKIPRVPWQGPLITERRRDRKKVLTPEHCHWLQKRVSMSWDVLHPQASLPSPCGFLPSLWRAIAKARSSVLLPKECERLPTSSYTQPDAQRPTRIRKHHLDFQGQTPLTQVLLSCNKQNPLTPKTTMVFSLQLSKVVRRPPRPCPALWH